MNDSLNDIFKELKALLEKYSPPLKIREDFVDETRRYDLWSNKEAPIEKRKRKEVFFPA